MAGKKNFVLPVKENGNNNSMNKIAETNAKAKFQIKFIPHDKFYVNELNKSFSQEELEELAFSIKTVGLLHNLVAVYDPEKDMYRIISGERRWRAIGLHYTPEEMKEDFPAGLPTKIETATMDEIDEEIRLREANTDRGYTESEYRENINRLIELYKIKQQRGENPNLAKIIAKKVNLSERQVQKYINIERLIPELDELFKNKQITLTYADKFSALPVEAQKYIYNLYKSGKGENITEDYEAIKKSVDTQKEENKRLHQEIENAKEELNKKEETISALEQQIANAKTIPYEQADLNEIIKELTASKERAEREEKKWKNKVDELQQQQKESKNVMLSEDELKKIQIHTKTERAIDAIEKELKSLKENKTNILEDEIFKNRLKIISTRIQHLLEDE